MKQSNCDSLCYLKAKKDAPFGRKSLFVQKKFNLYRKSSICTEKVQFVQKKLICTKKTPFVQKKSICTIVATVHIIIFPFLVHV